MVWEAMRQIIELHFSKYTIFYIFFFWAFVSRTFTNHSTAGERGGHFFNSTLPLPPTSQTLRHQPGDYSRELTSAHSSKPDSNRESLVSERKSLTTSYAPLLSYYRTPLLSLHESNNEAKRLTQGTRSIALLNTKEI